VTWISDRLKGLRSLNESRRSFGGSSSNGGMPRSLSSNRKASTYVSKFKSPNRAGSAIL